MVFATGAATKGGPSIGASGAATTGGAATYGNLCSHQRTAVGGIVTSAAINGAATYFGGGAATSQPAVATYFRGGAATYGNLCSRLLGIPTGATTGAADSCNPSSRQRPS